MSDSIFFMAGTEGTGLYMVPVVTNRAKVGFREYRPGCFRVRVEPLTGSSCATLAPDFPKTLPGERGWKQVGDNNQERFSIEVVGQDKMRETVAIAVKAVSRFARSILINPDAPEWSANIVAAKP